MSRFFVLRFGSLLAFVGAVALLLPGCSKPVGTVSGKVTYQGKVVKGGSVAFVSTDGSRSFAGGIKEDGTYSVPDIIGGTYKVTVDTSALKPPEQMSTIPGGVTAPIIPKGAKTGPPPGAPVPEGYAPSDPTASAAVTNKKKYVPIPPQYADPDKSGLTFTFTGGSQTFDIELK